MKHKQLSVSLTEALHALSTISEGEIQQLSLADCARMISTLPPEPKIARVRAQLANRLQRQLSTSWIEKGNAYEVFSVLVALWQYQRSYVTGEHLAATLRRLIAAERAIGGPYYFKDTDIVSANALIAIFMRLVAKPLPNVTTFLEHAIDDSQLNRTALIYLLAHANITSKLVPYVRNHWTHESWQTPLAIATALTVLEKSAPPHYVDRALSVLYAQQHNGLWEDCRLLSPRPGSKFVTTAIIVGVLTTYQPSDKVTVSRFRKRQQVILGAASQTFDAYTNPLRSTAIDLVAKVGSADKNFEITQLSVLFANALRVPDALTDQQHAKLGLASLFGWIAYTVYDDFLDGAGRPARLPVANIAMRTSIEYFRVALPAHTTFVRYAHNAFSIMDEANAWEVGHCRFVVRGQEIVIGELPKYGQRTMLAKRSFAHSLAPMAALWEQAGASTAVNTRHIKAAFTHYLIARQLVDDLYDWVDDIKTGQASYVVTAILRDIRVRPGAYRLDDLLPLMQQSFKHVVLPKVCQYILQHVASSRQEFQRSDLLYPDSGFYALLDRLEMTAQHSLDARAKNLTFYEATKTIKF